MKLNLELAIEVNYKEGATDSVKDHLNELVYHLTDGLLKTSHLVDYNIVTNRITPAKSTAILLTSDDGYEALYLDGQLVTEGNPINEGFSRTKIFTTLAEDNNFVLSEMREKVLSAEDNDTVAEYGSFHQYLYEYEEQY